MAGVWASGRGRASRRCRWLDAGRGYFAPDANVRYDMCLGKERGG